MSVFKQQAEFMSACGQTVEGLNIDQAQLYAKLVVEEYGELITAGNVENELKELMDLMVVIIGYGLSHGWDLEGAWNEVWQSNMSKIDPETGTVLKREDGKVQKGIHYKPADVSKFV